MFKDLPAIYYGWLASLIEQRNFAVAMEKVKLLQQEYPTAPEAKAALKRMEEIFTRVSTKAEDQDFCMATSVYDSYKEMNGAHAKEAMAAAPEMLYNLSSFQ